MIEFSINLFKVFNYVVHTSSYLQDVSIVVYYPANSNEPPPAPICPTCVDDAEFLDDIILPDGTVVTLGEALIKTWRVRNSGTSTWDGYTLVFQSGDQMGGSSPVAIPHTTPGQEVDISVSLTAPDHSAAGRWHIVDPAGTHVPGGELWVSLVVEDNNNPPPPASDFTLECLNCPSTVEPGQTFRPVIRAMIGSGQMLESRGDMLRHKSGDLFGAWPLISVSGVVNQGESYDFTFYADNPITAPTTNGAYQSTWQLWQNGQWVGPEFTITFTVQSGGGSNRPPNAPSLTGPGDWAVYQGNSGILLASQENGDPDGDAVTQYYFEIFDSAQNANSGWIASNSWSPQGLGFYGYQWHVKVRDSKSAESGWSETWHFTVYDPNINITQLDFVPLDPDGEIVRILACADAPATLKVDVNTANDGSDNGEWRTLKELGVQCFNDNDAPTWNTLEYEAGPHLVRVLARGNGGWANAASREAVYTVPANRRPNQPFGQLPQNSSYVNSTTVTFKWIETLRTTSYRLQAATDAGFGTLLLDQTLSYGITSYTHTFSSAYGTIYWRVIASGPYGTNEAGQSFSIDTTPPASSVTSLPAVTTDTQFSVNWAGSDARSGVRWYDVQARDGNRPDDEWEGWLVRTTKTAELFQGQAGHTYYFRVRAMDEIGNWEAWPAGDGDTYTAIDPAATPPTPWWNDNYAEKRNLVILNNDSDTIPAQYPIHIRFDNTTNPTAAEIYNASLTATKGNDVRVLHNNQTELPRFVTQFTSAQIDIWFPLQAGLGGGQTDNGSYQLYYGYAGAGSPPGDADSVFLPKADGNTMGLWHFQEGSGSTIFDSSGRGHNGSFTGAAWTNNGYLGRTGSFNGSSAYVQFGHSDDFWPSPVTLEAWIYISGSTGDYPMIFNKDRFWFRVIGDRKLQFLIKADGGDRTVTGQTVLNLNQWYHVAATYDGGQKMRVYVNGSLDKEENIGAPPVLWNTQPLRIGRSDYNGNSYFPGFIQHARFSNVGRTDFSYGRIDIPASVAAGMIIPKPAGGAPNLAMLDLTTYPNPDGGVLVQAVIQNQGDGATKSGFYTDLYLDYLPTGAGDYTNSLQFWVNDPIEAGAVVTLTTVITNGLVMNNALFYNTTAAGETNGTLYAQVDSAGSVTETDDNDNIYATGADVCLVGADAYENDETPAAASPIALGEAQTHNFDRMEDEDWLRFNAQAGITYTLRTSNLGVSADTYLYLYDSDGTTLLASNDDYDGALSSYIEWAAPASGVYYARIRHWNPNVGGCGTSYDFRFAKLGSEIFLPVVVNNTTSPNSTPTPIPTPAPTSTPTFTPTPSPTPTATPTSTPVPSYDWALIGSGSPSARSGMSFAYDDNQNKLIMFGGTCNGYACSDTWEYTATSGWQQINVSGPSARETAYMTYDSTRQKIVLFGGHVWAGSHLNDTWEFDGTNWAQITTATTPPNRSNQAIAFDPSRNKVVMFGGWFASQLGDDILGDTWEYDGIDWVQITTATSPTPRSSMKLVYVPDLGGVVLFGGIGSGQIRYNDTWLYDGQNWTQLSPTQSPSKRFAYQMTYDPNQNVIILFGGGDTGSYNDTWIFDGNNWQLAAPTNSPPPTWSAGFAYYPPENGVFMFGGNSPNQNDLSNEMWLYSPVP